ncbi:MAG: DUF423 domain-containing protein [Chitinophagaceae bacterium]|nr:DUF423 domain-containing protein [Chitinophagaceae bacterium]
MHKKSLIAAAIFGGLAVALGAFGAHGLEKITSDEKILHGYQTGVQYQMYHALALIAVGILYGQMQGRFLKWAADCFIAGIFLFSGSLYLLTFFKIQGTKAVKFAGPITPLGGIFFIAGWLLLLLAVLKKK